MEQKIKFRKPPATAGRKRKRWAEEHPQGGTVKENLPIQENFAMKSLTSFVKQQGALFKMKFKAWNEENQVIRSNQNVWKTL